MSRDIVVGLDGSRSSTQALVRAVAEARSTGMAVRAVHSWSTPAWQGAPGFGYGLLPAPDELRASAEALLDQQLAAFEKDNDTAGVTLRPCVYEGDAKRALVEAAADAALLVVGSRGAGRLHSLLLGSVSSYALHHCTTPLMLVPDPESESLVLQQVVVGLDGSEASRSALRWALQSARRHECPLIAIHVWAVPPVPGSLPAGSAHSLSEYPRKAEEWLDAELAAVIPDREGVSVLGEVTVGTASAVLLERAGRDGQLVLGRRGRGGFAELVLGSTASQCAQHARGVVVIVHAGEERLEG